MSALRTIAQRLSDALRPLERALASPAGFRSLLLRLGWRASDILPEWQARRLTSRRWRAPLARWPTIPASPTCSPRSPPRASSAIMSTACRPRRPGSIAPPCSPTCASGSSRVS
jgi:hypothetical protein